MKSLKLITLSILCLGVFSCSSDDDAGNTVAVEGTWKLTAINTETEFDLNMDGTATNSFIEETDCYRNETIVFNSNGTGANNSASYAEIEYEITVGTTDEFTYTVDCISEIESDTFTWTQNGNQLTITDSSGFGTTVALNGSQFTFVVPEGFFAADGTTGVELTEDLTFIYTKQ